MGFKKALSSLVVLGFCVLSFSNTVKAEGIIENKDLLYTMHQVYWDTYDIQFKKDLLYVLAYNCAEYLGTDIPSIEYYCEGEAEDGSLSRGKYNTGNNVLYINEYILDSASTSLHTVSHEMRHYYQWKCANNPISDVDYVYKNNFENYIDASNMGYSSQPIEKDAEIFADCVFVEFSSSQY